MTCRPVSRLLLSAALLLPLAACQAVPAGQRHDDRLYDNGAPHTAASTAAPAPAPAEAQASLPSLERAYKHDSGNPDAAVRYATALQDAGRGTRAIMVLSPFIESGKADKNAALLTAYASVQTSIGNYDAGVTNAQKAVDIDPKNAQAYHILGIALDAQGNHPDAEDAFRRALKNWQGNPSPVLNNLGLNLASQGFIDEAVDTLKQAVALSPDRPEIERNLRIVVALQNQPGTHENKRVPPPPRKPSRSEAAQKADSSSDDAPADNNSDDSGQ